MGACVIGNFLVYCIPPARRAMDAETRGFPGTDYSTAQKALSKLTGLSLSGALAPTLIGMVLLR